MPSDRATLTLTADADNDGTDETGVFEMVGNLEVRPTLQPSYVINGRGSGVSNIALDAAGEFTTGRKGLYLDAGGGLWQYEIAFRGWEGAVDQNDNDVQWGRTDDPTVEDKTSATGAAPLTQIDVLQQYLSAGTFSSTSPATLEVGEYTSDGSTLYDAHKVVPGPLETTRVSDEGDVFDGNLTLYVTRDVSSLPFDADLQQTR